MAGRVARIMASAPTLAFASFAPTPGPVVAVVAVLTSEGFELRGVDSDGRTVSVIKAPLCALDDAQVSLDEARREAVNKRNGRGTTGRPFGRRTTR